MATPRRLRFVYAQTGLMVASVLVLVLLGAFSLELFFVLSLISALVVTELTAPFSTTPAWRRRLRWVLLLGLLGFGYIVARRIATILANS
ncbi:hypothetical protein [Haloplanus halobius]|uniref:hypothetical protein n=1 Tax=Haloplanus halobius TaxID=2934938 RepID=UPI00200D54CF|nr:hypothetical protein [Haloplanus sp. XH21]